jgi:hypothetical protein
MLLQRFLLHNKEHILATHNHQKHRKDWLRSSCDPGESDTPSGRTSPAFVEILM